MFNRLFSMIGYSVAPSGRGVVDAVTRLDVAPPSFPPAGSYNSTLFGETYPTAEGGTSFTDPTNGAGPQIPNQICDVDVLNDGSGGTYIDWSSATNVQYKAYGVVFITESSLPLNIEVPSGGGFYYQGGTYDNQYFHDGTGSWSSGGVNQSYYSNGSDTYIENLSGGDQQTEVPSGSGNYYSNGQFDGYTWDGSGGYNFPVLKGAYYSNGTDTNLAHLDSPQQTEVPSGSMNYYNNGLFDGYTWDGNGGYNYPVTKGAYYSSGTVIFYYDNTVEVPSGSGQNFSNGTFQEYQWDGSGGYNDTSGGSYYSYGDYITNYAGVDYYWDGNGGYYS